MSHEPNHLDLPEGLPEPVDDGACDHLPGMQVPPVTLTATTGQQVSLAELPGRIVIYCYPKTGRPDRPVSDEWNQIPGARGCTPQSCSFRDHYRELQNLGADVFGLSSQSTDYQQEAVERLHLPFALLSDENLEFQQALRLPTFEFEGETLIRRLTMIVRDGTIEHVFYPVFPPDADANRVIEWLSTHS